MPERAPTDRPNIILIQCEDMGYGDLGCYGSTVHDTPAIDTLASQGIRFTDFNTTAPVCTPARAALLTGCFAQRNGMGTSDGDRWVCFPGNHAGLDPGEITIARLLKQQGYATQMVGKWHCGDQREFLPTRHGFDHYYGVPFSNDMGVQVGREGKYPPLPLMLDEEVLQAQPDQAALTERYVEQCVRFLRDKRDEPFFLYFAHSHMHVPLYAPQRFVESSRNGIYGAAMHAVDWSVAVLMYELKRLGLDKHTLVVFTVDHGSRAQNEGGSNLPMRGQKGQTWEGGVRVPCIARWPGQIPAGQTCDHLVAGIDWLPTLATIAGTTPPSDRVIDGKDIRPLLTGEPGAAGPHEAMPYYLRYALKAIRVGDWKLHLTEGDRALYNLAADPGESTNLIDAHPDIVRDLEAHAQRYRHDLGDSLTGVTGTGRRKKGHVEHPVTLTTFDPDYPYIEPIYTNPKAG